MLDLSFGTAARLSLYFVLAATLALAARPAAASTHAPTESVARAIEVWSLARHHHPDVVRCARDWDAALTEALPALEASTQQSDLEQALTALLDRAGASGSAAADGSTPAWIAQSGLGPSLQGRLTWLAAQRPQRQCYVAPGPGSQASFPLQTTAPASPDRAQRILAVAQFWAAIEYFFPYRNDIGRPWSDVLREHLPGIAEADTPVDYVQRMRRFTAEIQDAHAFYSAPRFLLGDLPIPAFRARRADGRVLVEYALPAAAPVAAGDEVIEIDGEDIATRWQRFEPYSYGSNPITIERNTLSTVLGGISGSGRYRLRRPDGSEYTAQLVHDYAHYTALRGRPHRPAAWWIETLEGGCRAGVVDMFRLRNAQVDTLLAELAATDLMVLDLRTYPVEDVMWALVDRLYPQPRTMALLDFPDFTRPGHYQRRPNVLGGRRPAPYRGRLLVLVDDETQSAAEFSAMGFQAIEGTLVIGSQTAGADGNISRIDLAGGVSAWFSGLGVYYPDGRPTQRVGIVPDLHVYPDADDLQTGRDAVLQAALDCRWVDTDPAPRDPPSGMYWQPERNGEGYDLVRAGGRLAVFRYGYDEAGQPEWLLGASDLLQGTWQAAPMRHLSGQAPEPAASALQLDFQRGPYHPACAIADQGRLHPRASLSWADAAQSWPECLQPFLITSGQGLSGSWAGPDEELGWGLNLHEQAGHVHAVLFVHDSQGRPRWLLGSAERIDGETLRIPMLRFTGFCRGCDPTPIQATAAGEIELHLPQPSGSLDAGNWFSSQIDVDAESRWERERMPLRRLSSE